MPKPTPHINLPLDRLMQALTEKDFRITPDMYLRVQTIFQQLGEKYQNQPEKLAHILAPVVAKNPQEQEIFYEVFWEYLKEFEVIEIGEAELSLSERILPPIKKEWYRNPLIWLGLFGVLGLGILFYNYNKKPIEPTQPSFPIDTQTTVIDTAKVETPSILPIDSLQSELQITVGTSLDRDFAYESPVWSVAFSPNGEYLATALEDNTARIWSVETGEEIQRLQGHESNVESVAFSPNGKYLATASWDNTARIWSVETGEEIQRLEGHESNVESVAFSLDSEYLVTASRDKTVRSWLVRAGVETYRLQRHESHVESVAFSPNGQYLATASYDKTARIWSVGDVQEIHRLQGEDYIESVAFSPDSKYLATASWDNTTRIWSVKTGEEIRRFQGHQDVVLSVAFSPDGKYLATSSLDTTARIWLVETGEEIRRFQGHKSNVESVAFSPNGRYLATASWDKTVRIWDLYPNNYLNIRPTQKAYFYPLLLFLLLSALATTLFNKVKTFSIGLRKNSQPPYKIPFPEQDLLPATPQIHSLAKVMRHRQTGLGNFLDLPATIRATIDKGGFPVLRHRGVTRPPEYLLLIDLETPEAEEVRWLEYILELLEDEEVLISRFYFKQDPTWCWNPQHPNGLSIYELHRYFTDHVLIVYGDGSYWLDKFEARTDKRVLDGFPLWSQRALLTTVPPENWSYRERLLQEYFNLILGDIDDPLVLTSTLMSNPKDFEQIRQDRSHSTEQFIEFNTLDDIRDFLQDPRLVDWLAATTVYPEPQWEITLAVGKALEQLPDSNYQGILTLPNLRRLTQIKWMNRDAFPENLRQDLLAHLHTRPQVATRARETVIGLLQAAQNDLPPDSYAHTDARIKIVEQQLNTPPVSRQTEAEAQQLIDQKLMREDEHLTKKRFRRKAATIAGTALTAALLTLILCTATLNIFPQITEKWGLVETVSFDLPIRIDDPRVTNQQDSLGVKIVSANFQRAFNVMANEDYLVEGIPIEFLDAKGKMEIVIEGDTIEVDSFVLSPTPMQQPQVQIDISSTGAKNISTFETDTTSQVVAVTTIDTLLIIDCIPEIAIISIPSLDRPTQLMCNCTVKWSFDNGVTFTAPSTQHFVKLPPGNYNIVLDYKGIKYNKLIKIEYPESSPNSVDTVRNNNSILEIIRPSTLKCKEESVFVVIKDGRQVNGTVTWALTYNNNTPISENNSEFKRIFIESGDYRLQASYLGLSAEINFNVTDCREIPRSATILRQGSSELVRYLNKITKRPALNPLGTKRRLLKQEIDKYTSCGNSRLKPWIRIDGVPGEQSFDTFFESNLSANYKIKNVDVYDEQGCITRIVIYKK